MKIDLNISTYLTDFFVGTVLGVRGTSRLAVLSSLITNVNFHGIAAHLRSEVLSLGGVSQNVVWNGSACPILPAPFCLSNEAGSTLASYTNRCHRSTVTMVTACLGGRPDP